MGYWGWGCSSVCSESPSMNIPLQCVETHACNPNILETEELGSGVQGHLWLHTQWVRRQSGPHETALRKKRCQDATPRGVSVQLTFTCGVILGVEYSWLLQRADAGVHQLEACCKLVFDVFLSIWKGTESGQHDKAILELQVSSSQPVGHVPFGGIKGHFHRGCMPPACQMFTSQYTIKANYRYKVAIK